MTRVGRYDARDPLRHTGRAADLSGRTVRSPTPGPHLNIGGTSGDDRGRQKLSVGLRRFLGTSPISGGTPMDIVAVAGLWLDGSAWDEVVPSLTERGHRVRAVTLPGQGDGTTSATLEDQVAAVVAAVDECGGPVLVVGHSAASTLAWLAADRRPDAVAAAALVGATPSPRGRRTPTSSSRWTGSSRSPGGDRSTAPTSPTSTRRPANAWPPPPSRCRRASRVASSRTPPSGVVTCLW
ncbi:MAG: alpha/beta fold hydrolase [Nocardioides sp.]|uniref:alpha/beta fold hydrolase n=1 Tax=Nocardioides sp. TaxID=35761 RepID=UPI003EFC8A55